MGPMRTSSTSSQAPGFPESAPFLLFLCAYGVGGNDSDATKPEFCVLWYTGNNGQYAILTYNTGGKPTEKQN